MAEKGGNLGKVAIKQFNWTTLQQEPPRNGVAPFPKGGKTGR